MDVSVCIPARNEQYLGRTIESVLAASEADTEVIAILDGYWPTPPIQDHPKVILIHHTEPQGQRQSINEAARLSKSKFIMKLDAHCSVGPGFDRILIEDYQEGQTVVPRQYNLDVETWQPRDLNDTQTAIRRGKLNDYMYIGWNEKDEFRTLYYNGVERKRWHSRPQLLDEIMSCMGPGWFLSREQFWKQGGCDEGHGSWGQQGIEVALKAWLIGEGLWVNKKTWFSHWFRGGGGPGFPYPIGGREVGTARKYSQDLWLNNKCPGQTKTFKWLLKKFWPVPGWTEEDLEKPERVGVDTLPEGNNMGLTNDQRTALQATFYRYTHLKKHDPQWRGIRIVKLPTDLSLYHQALWDLRPDFVVEVGTAFCGSALFFADTLDLIGKGHVISIDTAPRGEVVPHPRITYLKGDSKSPEIIKQIKALVGSGSVIVSLDGNHARPQVKWELKKYGPLVTSGQYMVVEDCYGRQGQLSGPGEARDWFLGWNRSFKQTNFDAQFLVGFTKGGWLLKR